MLRDHFSLEAPPTRGRRVHDAVAGHEWAVRECRDCVPASRRAEGCLVFEFDTAARRVWGVPAGWREMPEEALVALMYRDTPPSA